MSETDLLIRATGGGFASNYNPNRTRARGGMPITEADQADNSRMRDLDIKLGRPVEDIQEPVEAPIVDQVEPSADDGDSPETLQRLRDDQAAREAAERVQRINE